MVRIKLLGPVQIERDGETVRDLRSQKALGLLGYLCLQGRPITRTYLVELFWPDLSESRGRRNLSWALSQLSKHLAGCFETTRQTVSFVSSGNEAEIWVDVLAYQIAVSQGELAAALPLYQDDLMSGLYLDDCPEFETWLVGEREVWRRRIVQHLTGSIQNLVESGGQSPLAIEQTQQLLRLEPWNEAFHRQLMRLYVYHNQVNFALAHYERCKAQLAEELDVEPEAETVDLFEAIRAGEINPPEPTEPGDHSQSTPARSRKSNIQTATQIFVGRQAEREETRQRLLEPSCRLLTIVGPGGIGKTRLALEVARQFEESDAFPDGIFWIPLQAATDWSELLTAVSHTLSLSDGSQERDQLQNEINAYLHGKKLLLVLDNFEHLLSHSAQMSDWLHQLPGIKFLLTSRRRLNIQSEWRINLEGLSVPTEKSAQALDGFEATRLFLHRVRQVGSQPLSEDEAAAVVEICRLVEGMPLAIELAASWTRMLSPIEIMEELEQGYDWLETDTVDVAGRHRNLNAVVDYSWRLLTDSEQEALSRLSLFSGFRREMAREVAGTTLQTLARLIDHSMVQKTTVPGRFRIHSVVRHFAAKQLAQSPQSQAEAAAAYLQVYQRFLRERERPLLGQRQLIVLQEVIEELNNVGEVWRQAVEERGSSAAVHFFEAAFKTVFYVYDVQSWFREGLMIFEQATESLASTLSDPQAALVWHKLLGRQAWFLFHAGRLDESRRLLQQSVNFLTENGPPEETLFSRNYLAAVLRHSSQLDRAAEIAQESFAIATELNLANEQAVASNIRAQVAYDQARYAEAQAYGQQSLEIERQIGNRRSMGYSLINLGNVALAQGEIDEAEGRFLESLEIRETLNDLHGTAVCYSLLGTCAEMRAADGEARILLQKSGEIFEDLHSVRELASVRKRLAALHA